jgi:GNAT superfamily N-acetyltransferase
MRKVLENPQETAPETADVAAPPSIQIRPFRPGDEAAFRRLNEEWIVRHFALEDADRELLGDPAKHILAPGGQIWLAVDGEEAVGCCALIREEPGLYLVAKMGVTEAYQGRGIGRKLLAAVIAGAKELGASRLSLESNTKLPSAIHLYESAGFRHLPPHQAKPSPYSRTNVSMEMLL